MSDDHSKRMSEFLKGECLPKTASHLIRLVKALAGNDSDEVKDFLEKQFEQELRLFFHFGYAQALFDALQERLEAICTKSE